MKCLKKPINTHVLSTKASLGYQAMNVHYPSSDTAFIQTCMEQGSTMNYSLQANVMILLTITGKGTFQASNVILNNKSDRDEPMAADIEALSFALSTRLDRQTMRDLAAVTAAFLKTVRFLYGVRLLKRRLQGNVAIG